MGQTTQCALSPIRRGEKVETTHCHAYLALYDHSESAVRLTGRHNHRHKKAIDPCGALSLRSTLQRTERADA